MKLKLSATLLFIWFVSMLLLNALALSVTQEDVQQIILSSGLITLRTPVSHVVFQDDSVWFSDADGNDRIRLSQMPSLASVRDVILRAIQSDEPSVSEHWKMHTFWDKDGIWVFCTDGFRKETVTFKGRFWYICNDRVIALGRYSDNISDFGLTESIPHLFYCETYSNDMIDLHVAILEENVPVVSTYEGMSVSEQFGVLTVHSQNHSEDSEPVIISVNHGKLYEVAGSFIDKDTVDSLPGLDHVFDMMFDDAITEFDSTPLEKDIKFISFIYYPVVPKSESMDLRTLHGAVAVNFSYQYAGFPAQNCHFYIWIDSNGTAHPDMGLDSVAAIYEGIASPIKSIGLPIIYPG